MLPLAHAVALAHRPRLAAERRLEAVPLMQQHAHLVAHAHAVRTRRYSETKSAQNAVGECAGTACVALADAHTSARRSLGRPSRNLALSAATERPIGESGGCGGVAGGSGGDGGCGSAYRVKRWSSTHLQQHHARNRCALCCHECTQTFFAEH